MVTTGEDDADSGVDLRGTLRVVRGVPGLLALIAFSCFNNFIGGAFMAVMDPTASRWCPCRRGACCGGC